MLINQALLGRGFSYLAVIHGDSLAFVEKLVEAIGFARLSYGSPDASEPGVSYLLVQVSSISEGNEIFTDRLITLTEHILESVRAEGEDLSQSIQKVNERLHLLKLTITVDRK